MKHQIEAQEQHLERLLGEAAVCARTYRAFEMRPEHLLFVISGTEEGRRVIESMGGHPRKVRRFLEQTFEFNAAQGRTDGAIPPISEALQSIVQPVVAAAREKQEPLTLRSLVRGMIRMGDSCQVTRQALRSGGLIEPRTPRIDDDYRLEEEIDETPENLPGDPADLISSDDWPQEDEAAPFPPSNIDPVEDGEDDNATASSTPDSRDQAADRHQATRQAAQAGQASSQVEEDEHHKAVMGAIRNLTSLAERGKLDDVIGRDKIIGHVADTLCRRSKSNVILSGEPGVGKTAIAEGLAQFLSTKAAPAELRARPVLEVMMSNLVAGTRFRGDFEARISKLMEVARAERAILFIDEIHTIVGAGSTSGAGGLDASNILKPALARGGLSVVGATTPGEMRKIRKDGALMRRFQVEVVAEPDAAQTREIIDQAVGAYTVHHEVLLDDEVLDEVVSLADRYLPQRRFPDKAFDLIDTACVIARRRGEGKASIDDLRAAIPRLGGPRLGTPDADRMEAVRNMESRLKSRVFGQGDAAATLARAARISLLGLQPGGTAGSYLFNGPSGVGKSEMAVAFAEALKLPLVRISMSEFIEKHSVARLIGAPPGYVGYDEEGLLTAAGDTHPEFVLLLDEIEKAHPDVFDILLQVLDTGVLRAADGRMVSLAGAHVIMTANIGAAEGEKPAMGFGRQTDPEEAAEVAIKQLFRKEFRARIQKEIQFRPVDEDDLVEIAALEFAKLTRRLGDAALEVEIDGGLAERMAKSAASQPFAVRSLQAQIRDDLSDKIVEAVLQKGGASRVSVKISDGEIDVIPS